MSPSATLPWAEGIRANKGGRHVADQKPASQGTSTGATVQAIVASLEEEIVLGRLRPRQRLLEEKLTEYFNAKRHVVRAALVELEAIGIVVRQANRGATVRDFSAEEVEQIYDVRELLERHAAAIMPLPPDPAVMDEIRKQHRRHSEAVSDGDLRKVFRANLQFHKTLFGACGNPYLAAQISDLASCAHAIRFHAITDPVLLEHARREHGEMVKAIEQQDRDRLVALVSEHIRPSKEAYLRLGAPTGSNPFE